ncbi:MAG: hypothetical protein QOJ42_1606 [Acidobacteriaceae bacterium]|nr:hypothetical protein [Acidobacteriaceae bacterium]
MVLKFCHPDPDFLPRCSGHGCVCASLFRSETNLSNNPLSPFCHSECWMGLRTGLRPTYEDENGFYSATSLPRSAALPFVISTGAHPDFLPRSPGQDRACAFL